MTGVPVSRCPRYRPDIDGLRALAILPVVFFHYRIGGFAGGFVGVDVFFVISGYLITALVVGEMAEGRFSFAHFYERRVRRIFPALFAMLAVVTAAALLLLFPFDLVRYARSLLASVGFAANFEFWSEAGYFDSFADQKPLLHLWSIAVEEQFYLLFPFVLWLLRAAASRRRIAIVAGIFAASLALSIWGAGHAPTAAFYLLPARAWELMLGALLALGAVPQFANGLAREGEAALGLVLIAAAVFAFTPATPFPGVFALLPCLGAALVIHVGEGDETFAGRLLAARPLVFIGLISYSLYLWHWPLYVFAKYVAFRELTLVERLILIAISFALAALSWQFVERPAREKSWPQRALLPAGAAAMAIMAAIAVVASSTDGLPQRLRPDLQRILAEQDDHEPRLAHCFALTAADVGRGGLCHIGAAGMAAPSFLLWGDSHADAILPAVAAAARAAGRTGLFAGGASCPPLLGVATPQADCRVFNEAVAKLAADKRVREVILEARWAKYAEGTSFGNEPHGHVVLSDSGGSDPTDNHAVFARGLERTIRALASKKIVLVADVPEVGWPVPARLAREALARHRLTTATSENVYLQRQKFVLATFARLQKLYGVGVLYPHAVLCRDGKCAVALDGVPLYRDEHHLSVYGARRLTALMARAFGSAS